MNTSLAPPLRAIVHGAKNHRRSLDPTETFHFENQILEQAEAEYYAAKHVLNQAKVVGGE